METTLQNLALLRVLWGLSYFCWRRSHFLTTR